MMNSGDSVQWLTYQESMAIRRAMIARHHEYIERRLVQNMPTKLVLAASIALIVIGLFELALQIVLIAESGPLYYIAHGIWGALVTFSFAAMCLILLKYRKYQVYIGTLITGIFYFALIIAAFVAVPFASIQISDGGCSSIERYEDEGEGGEICRSSQIGLVIAMAGLGLLATFLTLAFLIALVVIINGGCSMGSFYLEEPQQLQMSQEPNNRNNQENV